MAHSIVVHHERTSVVGPEQPGAIQHSAARMNSTTMTGPDPVAPTKLAFGPSRTWSATRTQFWVDKSAQVRPDSSQVIEPEESVLPPVLEELRDDVFTPSPSPRPSQAASTSATAPSTMDTVPSTTDTAPDTDSGAKDRRGQKRAVATSDTSCSRKHRTTAADRHRCPKRHHRPPRPSRSGLDTLSPHAHHHLGTPIFLSNNDRRPVHPTQGIPDSRSPGSRDGLRPSHQPVQHYTNPSQKDQSPRPLCCAFKNCTGKKSRIKELRKSTVTFECVLID